MAAMSVPPAPQTIGIMSNRRAPLTSVPNAVNSPRPFAAAVSKRSRLEFDAQEESVGHQQPPAKRQAVENARTSFRTPPRKQTPQFSEDRVFGKRPTNSQPNAFERKLLAAKERQTNCKTERQEKSSVAPLDGIRQWQKHYRKVFPYFVFYFESIPDDVRIKYSKLARILGAKEEKFFSKDVTHVITTRVIPVDSGSNSPTDAYLPSSLSSRSPAFGQSRTINPSFLDRSTEPSSLVQPLQPRTKFTFDTHLGKKPLLGGLRDSEPKRSNASNIDILSKAREMGMKIWQLEKLRRIMSSMFDTLAESKSQPGRGARNLANLAGLREEKGADLSRMLRNEQLNGPSDRDSAVTSMEIIPFKGPYIYVRDMDERTKPMIVKEYPKVSRSENGEWPQFRSVSAGKCPFIEEAPSKIELERAKARKEEISEEEELQSPPRTHAATVRGKVQGGSHKIPSIKTGRNQCFQELENADPLVPSVEKKPNEIFRAPSLEVLAGRRSPLKGLKKVPATIGPRMFGGEPAASGLQTSNVTSAIRSQMISSTAAAPGAKAGTSKEFQGLKRKVLERNSGPAPGSIHVSQRISDTLGSTRVERSLAVPRRSRAKVQEKLIYIDEESTQSEAEEDVWRLDEVKRVRGRSSRSVEKKDVKPGYCENCRDKYEDFDAHILGRKHTKFALTKENWKGLDKLLGQLGRRLKDDEDSGNFRH